MVPNFQNLNDLQLSNKISALVFKSAVWGVPIGMFFHVNELSAHQVSVMIDALRSSGATLMSNSQLVTYLLGAHAGCGHNLLRRFDFRRTGGFASGTDIAIGGPGRRARRGIQIRPVGNRPNTVRLGMGNRLTSVCSGVWRAPANSALRQFLISGFWFQIRLVWPRYFGSR